MMHSESIELEKVVDNLIECREKLIEAVSEDMRQRFFNAMFQEVNYHGKNSAIGISFVQVLTHIMTHKDFIEKHGER